MPLAAPAEPPVLKSILTLDNSNLLARFYDYDYFEEVMSAMRAARAPAPPVGLHRWWCYGHPCSCGLAHAEGKAAP